MHYTLNVAGLQRQLPICKVTDDLYIAAFVVFGDAELTVACARDLLKLVDLDSFDYMLTAEAHSETLEPMVVYRALYGEYGLWVRPAKMWSELVEVSGQQVPRFRYVGEE